MKERSPAVKVSPLLGRVMSYSECNFQIGFKLYVWKKTIPKLSLHPSKISPYYYEGFNRCYDYTCRKALLKYPLLPDYNQNNSYYESIMHRSLTPNVF